MHQVSGPRHDLDAGNPNQVYETIMDPDPTLNYVAAALRKSIDSYAEIAGFDISQNPGITATLYNIGNPDLRKPIAKARKRRNARRAARPPFPGRELLRLAGLQREAALKLQALFGPTSACLERRDSISLSREQDFAST